MIDPYLLVKWLHIVSATILFGLGLGTALHMWLTHLSDDPRAIATVARNVVRADWLFTLPSGVVQPISGIALIHMAGFDPWASWLVATYALYVLAGGCWLVVVRLQLQARNLAAEAVRLDEPLPDLYYATMRAWYRLGWPAFIALLVIFWLMVNKPTLW
ncbi:MAG: DUF2269 domain-containing protein [Minwuiales bacterium]|nr:DUF2269 domain-containing protein [Minwuiales bacterium]